MSRVSLRRADPSDIAAVARLSRRVRLICLPYLPDLHTPEEDVAFFRERVFPESDIWLAMSGGQLIGFAAAKPDWLDHLYVDPGWHGKGVGSALLAKVRDGRTEVNLWTFQRNVQARRFYERQGFRLVALTDGSGNEERCPDAHYRWLREAIRQDRR